MQSFRASIKQLLLTVHILYEFDLTCPNCGYHGMIKFKKNKKKETKNDRPKIY